MSIELAIPYLLKCHGWCTEEKMRRLYQLAKETPLQYDRKVNIIELGVYAGRSLFPMAIAYKESGAGAVIGVDAWDNIAPLQGTNHPANNKFWEELDINAIYNHFTKSIYDLQLQGVVYHEKCKSVDYAPSVKDYSCVIIHQDSAHNPETIIAELDAYISKLAIGGYWVVDDSDWPEVKDGYAKLPDYGLELREDYTSWQIWKKVR